jgi:hypothetical protein
MLCNEEKVVRSEANLIEKKIEEFRNIAIQENLNINIVTEDPTDKKKKEPFNFVFNEVKQKNIQVKATKIVKDDEIVPEPKIIKEKGNYIIVKETPDSEEMKGLKKDDPVIKMTQDLSCH